jgi:hypothetical protein
MILSFNNHQFEHRIIDGTKIFTCREDKHDRWKPGMKIHMWYGNPRNVKKEPYHFANAIVDKVDYVWISEKHQTLFTFKDLGGSATLILGSDLDLFAHQDGFRSKEAMFKYFGEFSGKRIYWKDLEPIKSYSDINESYLFDELEKINNAVQTFINKRNVHK